MIARRSGRLVLVFGLTAAGVLAAPASPASAHPLGNFSVNGYSGITVTPGRVRVDYVVDIAEIPTFQEMARIDSDGDGTAEEGEVSAWAARKARELASGLSLEVENHGVSLTLTSSGASLRPGQGGLDILRLESAFLGEVPSEGLAVFRDGNDEGRVGWREITATGAEGISVLRSSVPTASVSDELRSYPQGLLSSPLNVRSASFAFEPGIQEVVAGTNASHGGGARPAVPGSALTGLVARPELSLAIVLLSLLVAFGVGALHALAPGHGKTLTAAYLTAGAGRVRDAIGAGAAVSILHTASVVGLGLVVILAQRTLPAERVYPWLGLVAGLVATTLGSSLLLSRLGGRRHAHTDGTPECHGHHHGPSPLSRRGLAAVALAGGILPSPTAVVVLLAAVSLDRLAFGLGLIVAFGVGLAAAVSAIGILAMRARDAFSRRFAGKLAVVPLLSAGAIVVVGLVLTGRGLAQL